MNNDTELISKKIHLLPEHLIDQIKAGEVVERPAAVIKELLENSLDAKAQNIELQLINNGLDLIAINDDGEGIDIVDLPYAFCRHATSKIARFEDLYALHSFGFRGEALASISSISRLQCSSMPKFGDGGKIVIHGSEHKSLTPFSAIKSGTSIYIKDLFFNTPARLKFVRSKSHELLSLKKTINIFLSSHPETSFSIKIDDKDKVFFPAQKNIKKRLEQIISKKNDVEILHSHKDYEGYELELYFSRTPVKSNQKHQYFFTNDRFFVDKNLHQALMRSLESIWGIGQSGHYFAFFKVPAPELDVNVHPSKTTIKFLRPALIFSLLSAAAKEHIVESSLTTTPELPTPVITPSEVNRDRSKAGPLFITDNYFLINNENKYYLCSLKEFFKSHWENILENDYSSLREDMVTPLLISEPYPLLDDTFNSTQKNLLKVLGLDLEQSKNVLVIKTYPNLLKGLPLKEMLTPIIDLIVRKKISSKNDIINELSKIKPHHNLANFIDSSHHTHLIELTEETLKKIINHE